MPTTVEVYGYGLSAVALCCICSLGGTVILPCSNRFNSAFHAFMSIFLGLAVGTLLTGAIVHLIPEALGVHRHNFTSGYNVSVNDHVFDNRELHVESYIWYCLIILLATYLYYMLEIIMVAIKKRKGYVQSNDTTQKPVELDITVHKQDNRNVYNNMDDEISDTTTADDKSLKSSNNDGKGLSSLAIMVIVGDAIHNAADGLAMGAAFTSSIAEGITLTIAIFCHELPHELGDFAVLLSTGMGYCKAVMANLFSSLTAFIGFVVGVFVSTDESARQWILALTAGMFLYISLVDLLPELVRTGSVCLKTFCFHNIGILLGALILVAIAVFGEHIHVHQDMLI